MPRMIDSFGDTYHCTVDSSPAGCIIHLRNEKMRDEWTCEVTFQNIDSLWSGSGPAMLCHAPFTAVGVLQDLIHGTSYCGTMYGSVTLTNKFSPYYMELQLKCQLQEVILEWKFPMVPKDVSALERRAASKALGSQEAVKLST
ncbi:hypothetical protein PF005_g6351 [Phytophthora fragariae]|uniref:Uncharacterized protein n=1 Tax=Phytophthora fragariae TaxID=53985 RepID=A0A6A4ELS7_9STRA|nr:hypothetical protein PF009_g4755 [Phytophthora fragariae]KAE9024696.1 hypothetical protein PF011_g3373 [Phytophthora fragariae]KAE9123745.1 hypothetical protein PF010_g6262 [Phytophthora fragariae]KAE9134468.1 hypothetical protein PF007_g2914 [Phytophthora fragariae]KAE9152597.1 hypothetical protein PF006_g3192 [Phytophthora fragariae]